MATCKKRRHEKEITGHRRICRCGASRSDSWKVTTYKLHFAAIKYMFSYDQWQAVRHCNWQAYNVPARNNRRKQRRAAVWTVWKILTNEKKKTFTAPNMREEENPCCASPFYLHVQVFLLCRPPLVFHLIFNVWILLNEKHTMIQIEQTKSALKPFCAQNSNKILQKRQAEKSNYFIHCFSTYWKGIYRNNSDSYHAAHFNYDFLLYID